MKMNHTMKSFTTAEQEKDTKDSISSDAVEEDATFIYLKHLIEG